MSDLKDGSLGRSIKLMSLSQTDERKKTPQITYIWIESDTDLSY